MIVIVDYRAGNLTSVKRALDHLGLSAEISADSERVRSASHVIFPGVGHATAAMSALRERGLDAALRDVHRRGTPILGICLGSQIVLERSEEGSTTCLGLIAGACRRFSGADPALKIPHMGWNDITLRRRHPVFSGIESGDAMYFVHSYFPVPTDPGAAIATAEYGETFTAAIARGNLVATQFHPEKSGRVGLKILENFAAWDGAAC